MPGAAFGAAVAGTGATLLEVSEGAAALAFTRSKFSQTLATIIAQLAFGMFDPFALCIVSYQIR